MATEIERMIERHGPHVAVCKLFVLAVDGTKIPCDTWPGPFDSDEKRIELREAIEERAQRQADQLGGTHAFWAEMRGLGDDVVATEIFRIAAEALPGRAGSIASEPSNEAGLFAQLMRHNEVNFRVSLMSFEKVALLQERNLARQQARIDALEQQRIQDMDLVQQAIMGTREHELNVIRESSKAEAKKVLVTQVQNLLPEVTAAVMHKSSSNPAAAAAAGMKGFLGTLRPDQVQKIFESLDPAQQLVLAQTMKRLAEAEAPPVGAQSKEANGTAH